MELCQWLGHKITQQIIYIINCDHEPEPITQIVEIFSRWTFALQEPNSVRDPGSCLIYLPEQGRELYLAINMVSRCEQSERYETI